MGVRDGRMGQGNLVADSEIHGGCRHCRSMCTETKVTGVWGDGGGMVMRNEGDDVCTRDD
jgi:hypothetical protein